MYIIQIHTYAYGQVGYIHASCAATMQLITGL